MKKTILIICCLSIAFHCSGQKKVSFDFHAGTGLSNIKGSNSDGRKGSTSPKLAFSSGIGILLGLNQTLSLGVEVNYQNIGGGEDKKYYTPLIFYKKTVYEYLSLPILLRFHIPKSRFLVYTGPQYSYMLNNKSVLPNGQIDKFIFYYKNEFSIVSGAEYHFKLLGNSQFYISGRYQQGISNIGINGEDTRPFLKNNALLFALGCRFSSKKWSDWFFSMAYPLKLPSHCHSVHRLLLFNPYNFANNFS